MELELIPHHRTTLQFDAFPLLSLRYSIAAAGVEIEWVGVQKV